MEKAFGATLSILLHVHHLILGGADKESVALNRRRGEVGKADAEVWLVAAHNLSAGGVNLTPHVVEHTRNGEGRACCRCEGDSLSKLGKSGPKHAVNSARPVIRHVA